MKYFTADVIDGNIRMKHHESVAVAVAPDDEDRAQGVAVCGLLQRGMCRPAWLARSDFVSKKRALQLARTTTTHGARAQYPRAGGTARARPVRLRCPHQQVVRKTLSLLQMPCVVHNRIGGREVCVHGGCSRRDAS